MPYRTRRWLWAGRIAAALALVGLAVYLSVVGTARAAALAAPIGLVVAVATLLAPFLLPTYERPTEPVTTTGEAKPVTSSDTAKPVTREPTPGAVSWSVTDEHASRGVSWPVRVGQVPPLASAFQDRTGPRERVLAARAASGGVALTQVLSGEGGVGKSQLAASFAHEAIKSGTDLVVWASAASAASVAETLAIAARRIQAPGTTGSDAEADAKAFLDWAAVTRRSWLVVFDDIGEPDQLAGWWPTSDTGTGWVLATTRRRDATLTGSGKTLVDIGVYSRAESLSYLTGRLSGAGRPDLADDRADALASELGDLPLALSHAAAFMIDQQITCGAYLDRLATDAERLDKLMPHTADADSYGRAVAATLLQALDTADACEPVGLASPAICLAGLLDPAGHPAALWETEAVTKYLAKHRAGPDSADQSSPRPTRRRPVRPADCRDVLLLLHRYGLASFDDLAGPRAVRVHALTGRAARETAPAKQVTVAVRTAADALVAIWPDSDQAQPALAATLRANAAVLTRYAGHELWKPDGHLMLLRTGTSLLNAGLHVPAIVYWQHLAGESEQFLGADHPDTLTARGNLASSYYKVGRTADAITIMEKVAADYERTLGPHHPDTLRARGNLAESYRQAGRTTDAITIEEKVIADFERILGPDHPDTLTARGNLASSYYQAGRTADAITIMEKVAADFERILGPDHPDTLTAQANLASSYWQAGRTTDAITIEEKVADDSKRILGPDHPDTLTAQVNLAASYQQAGRTTDAITIKEKVAADYERILGPHHPDTLRARNNLAASYRQAGRTTDAITIMEKVTADYKHILGPHHPHTLTAQNNLAASYQQAGRTTDAITIMEKVTADRERILGPDHPDTIAAHQILEQWKRRSRRR